ncbi:hypothetical protein [Ralstonia solanacearum]|nr:hypothetical protein [Ralstonia solanacearum]
MATDFAQTWLIRFPPGELGNAAAIDEVATPTEQQIEDVLAEAGV